MILGLLLGLLLLAGCASVPVVEIPVTDLAVSYADAKAEIAVAAYALTVACQGKKLPPETCVRLAAAYEKAKGLEVQVRTLLANPKRPFDPALLREYIGQASSLFGLAAGALGQGALGIP